MENFPENRMSEEEVRLADTLLVQGKFSELMSLSSALKDRYPDDAAAWRYFGYAQKHIGDLTVALEAAKIAVKVNPGDLSSLNLLGSIYKALKQYSDAESTYKAALKISPASIDTINNVALNYCEQGALDKGVKGVRVI